MYVFRVTYNPVAGKNQDVVALLKDRVKERQAAGVRIAMMSRVLWDDSEASGQQQLVSFFNELDEWGSLASTRVTKGPDPASVQYFQQILPLLRAPVTTELWEVLVPVKTPPKVGEFIVRQSIYPLPNHNDEFRNSLTELCKQMQAQGFNIGTYRQFLPQGGAVLQSIFPLARLGDWTALLARRAPEIFTWLRTYAALVRKPFGLELWAVATQPPQSRQ